MQRNSLNTKGFGLVAILMIVVALVVVGGSGAYVYHRDHKSKSSAVSDSSTTTKTSTHTSTTTAATDPYAGWNQYCSSYGHLCFKYPTNWTTSQGETYLPDQNSLSITSPSGSVRIDYSPADQGIGGACDPAVCFFDTLSFTSPTGSNTGSLKIVEGIFNDKDTSAILPFYYVSTSAQISQQGLISGQNVGTGFLYTEFPNPSGSGIEHLQVRDADNNKTYASLDQAKAWFSNSEVTTAGKVLSSVELK